MFWGADSFTMCPVFVIAQNHENFSSFQPGFGLQLNDHAVNVNGSPQISSGVLSTEMFWGVDFFTMVGIFLF
jgi:hypothetical protein